MGWLHLGKIITNKLKKIVVSKINITFVEIYFAMSERKRIPSGQTNFERIRTEGYLYVDKTRFIEMLENEDNQYHFFVRPRKFGKTLFTSVLEHYYDVRFANKFDQLFGDLYIGKKPTNNHNDLFVLNFDFSGIDTSSINDFNISLLEKIKMAVIFFLTDHRDFIKNLDEEKKKVWTMEKTSTCIEYALDIVKCHGKKAYVIIDEYDHFANDMIAEGKYLGEDIYKKTVWAGSQIRDFYETLKANSGDVIDKIFITGITPIMLDDLTSGFNISYNLSLEERYNEILGFTKEEVKLIIEECRVDKSLITNDIEYLYDGYLFHVNAKNKLYNSTMIFNYFHELQYGEVKDLVDSNLKTDYGRIQRLITSANNKDKLRALIDNKSVEAKIINKFSIAKINEVDNFNSLLFYMGLVTIENSNPEILQIKIPNYSVKTMFWEYIKDIMRDENEGISYNSNILEEALSILANKYDPKPFINFIFEYIVKYLSNRDLIGFDEKYIKIILLTILFQSRYFLPISELENSEGYTDIYLKRGTLFPKLKYEWIWEIKYVKASFWKRPAEIRKKQKASYAQLQKYKNSNLFKDRTDVRYLSVVFVGKKECIIEEI